MLKWPITLKNMPLLAGLLSISLAAFGQSNQGPAQAPTAVSAPTAASKPAASPSTPTALTAKQIIEKNVAARGGLAAWRAVGSMIESGKIDDGPEVLQQPFVLKLKRPHKSRLELAFMDQTAVQDYDGQNGWKLRLWHNAAEPYTAAELQRAADQLDLDGPLIDYAAKGTKVEYVGIEQVEGHDAYKLKLTLSDTHVHHIWVDTQSFLEVKIEASPRVMLGRERQSAIYFRDYRSVGGLLVPYVLETIVEGVKQTHKVLIEKVELNAKLDDRAFARPANFAPAASRGQGVPPAPSGAPPVKR